MTPHHLLDQLKRKSVMLDGQRVVAEQDVAEMYGVSLAKLRYAIRRNPLRFPETCMIRRGDMAYFTEVGILMVSSVIRNDRAVQISVGIVRELFSYANN